MVHVNNAVRWRRGSAQYAPDFILALYLPKMQNGSYPITQDDALRSRARISFLARLE
jgi:hypothetical protein